LVHCCVPILLLLFMEFTIEARIFVTRYLAVTSLMFPAGFCAHKLRAMHTGRTTVQLPAGVKLEIMAYCR